MTTDLALITALTSGYSCATFQPTTTPQQMNFAIKNEPYGPQKGIHAYNKMVINNLELGRGVVLTSTTTDLTTYPDVFYKNLDPCASIDIFHTQSTYDVAVLQNSANAIVSGAISGFGNYVVNTESYNPNSVLPADVFVSLSTANPCKNPIAVTTSSQSVQFFQLGSDAVSILVINNILTSQTLNIYSTTTNLTAINNFYYFTGTSACFPVASATNGFVGSGSSTINHIILNPANNGNFIVLIDGINIAIPSDITVKLQ